MVQKNLLKRLCKIYELNFKNLEYIDGFSTILGNPLFIYSDGNKYIGFYPVDEDLCRISEVKKNSIPNVKLTGSAFYRVGDTIAVRYNEKLNFSFLGEGNKTEAFLGKVVNFDVELVVLALEN